VTFNLTGPPGLFVSLDVSDGAYTEDVSGTLDPTTGTLSLTVNLINLADGSLTATASTMNASGSAASSSVVITKLTVPPAAPTLSLPKYVNMFNRTLVPLVVSGRAGTTASTSLTDGTTTVTSIGTVGSTGTVTFVLDLSGLNDGAVTATSYLTDVAGNPSPVGQISAVKDTVAPTGTFSIAGTVINGQLATKSPTLSLQLAFTDVGTGLSQMSFAAASSNGGTGSLAPGPYAATASLTLSGPDGLYTVAAAVTDVAGNLTVVTLTIRLDTIGPAITYSMTAPTNSGSYDVGTTITFNFSASSPDNVASLSATLDSVANLTNGQVIDLDTLTAGTHTIVITAVNQLATSSTTTITFQVHATVGGLISAVDQGAQRGLITSTEQIQLDGILNSAQSYLKKGNVAAAKSMLSYFISSVQSQSGRSINAAYAARLVNWAQDLYNRL
jgi:hypothetical protein